MARNAKRTVDYFPHVVKPGNTLYVLESRWGNDGYAFLFKLLETLCIADGLAFDFKDPILREVLLARARVTEAAAIDMLDVMAKLNNIDRELWSRARIVWSQDLVDNLSEVWRHRTSAAPQRPNFPRVPTVGNPEKGPKTGQSHVGNAIFSGGNTQSRVEKSREEERGSVFHNDNDNNIDSDKVETDAPPAVPSEASGETAGKPAAADSSDSFIKDEDVLAVARFYCELKAFKFHNEAARNTFLNASDVFLPAKDILVMAGGNIALAVEALGDLAECYTKKNKPGWDIRWAKKDFTAWDNERRNYVR